MIFPRHLAGEDLMSLNMKELKQLERQVKVGVERIRTRKVMGFFSLDWIDVCGSVTYTKHSVNT